MAARANLYGHAQIIVGDTTTHGGVVLSGSTTSFWYGTAIARMGDRVYCPKCKPHFFEIAEGLSNCTDHGMPMAGEGHLTTCGAALIAVGAASNMTPDVTHFENGAGFNDRYIFRDENHQPMANTFYGVKKAGGEMEYGTTDDGGHTHLYLTGENAEQVVFYLAG